MKKTHNYIPSRQRRSSSQTELVDHSHTCTNVAAAWSPMIHVDTSDWCSPLRVPRRHHLEQSNMLKTRLNQASKDHSPSGRDRICRLLPGYVYCLLSSNDPYFLMPHCLRIPHCQDNGQESPGTCSCRVTEDHHICAAAG